MMMMLMKYSSVLKLNTKRIGGWLFMHFYTHSLPTKSVFFTVQNILTMKTKVCHYKDISYAEIGLLICPMLIRGERLYVLESGGTFDL